MIRVLIVDDSRVAQEFLAHVLASDPAIQVIGSASDGAEALAAVKDKRPDVITMDIHMPQVDGYAATRAIMESYPTPIVVVTGSASAKGSGGLFRALEAGALAVVLRPPWIGHPQYDAAAKELIQTVKVMSEIKVVQRFPHLTKPRATGRLRAPAPEAAEAIELIAIGASIGGPAVLLQILTLLAPDLSVPVLIVQHIAPGFVAGFVDWLAGASGCPLHIGEQGQQPEPGHGYVAPDGCHMGVESGPRLVLSSHARENGSRPSVAYLLRTVAQVLGPRAVGVLLTGMGRDGANELKLMRDLGALTIAQDEASSVVHGMPGAAIKLGAATYVLRPESIATTLIGLVRKTKGVS